MNKAENGEELEVTINSGGGSVFAGSEIYTNLKDYEGNVKVKITGIAASAASVIAMAGDKILMSPTAQLMIHNSACGASGDHTSLKHTAEVLKSIDKSIANAYELKTGMEHSDLLALMENETWLNSQDALEKKFIDEVMFTENKFVNNIDVNADVTLPQSVIDKMRNELKKEPIEKNDDTLALAKAKLNLKWR